MTNCREAISNIFIVNHRNNARCKKSLQNCKNFDNALKINEFEDIHENNWKNTNHINFQLCPITNTLAR